MTLLENKNKNEIRTRIKTGWQAFRRYSIIMKVTLPICLTRKIFNQCILPAMTYRSETWRLIINNCLHPNTAWNETLSMPLIKPEKLISG